MVIKAPFLPVGNWVGFKVIVNVERAAIILLSRGSDWSGEVERWGEAGGVVERWGEAGGELERWGEAGGEDDARKFGPKHSKFY